MKCPQIPVKEQVEHSCCNYALSRVFINNMEVAKGTGCLYRSTQRPIVVTSGGRLRTVIGVTVGFGSEVTEKSVANDQDEIRTKIKQLKYSLKNKSLLDVLGWVG